MTELEVFTQTLLVSRISLAVSVIVSIASIVFGSLSMAFQRSHYRKSVKPFCNIHSFVSDESLNISIYNAGLGPMIITGLGVVKKDGKIKNNVMTLHEAFPSGIACEAGVTSFMDYIIPPMSERKILELNTGSVPDPGSMRKFTDIFNENCLYIKYSDLYGRKYTKTQYIPIPV